MSSSSAPGFPTSSSPRISIRGTVLSFLLHHARQSHTDAVGLLYGHSDAERCIHVDSFRLLDVRHIATECAANPEKLVGWFRWRPFACALAPSNADQSLHLQMRSSLQLLKQQQHQQRPFVLLLVTESLADNAAIRTLEYVVWEHCAGGLRPWNSRPLTVRTADLPAAEAPVKSRNRSKSFDVPTLASLERRASSTSAAVLGQRSQEVIAMASEAMTVEVAEEMWEALKEEAKSVR